MANSEPEAEFAATTALVRPSRLARVLAEMFAPAVLVAVVTFAVGVAASSTFWSGLLWSLISATFCSFIPLWFMARGASLGHWETHHVRDRADRLVPLLVAVVSVVVGLTVLRLGDAPWQLIALVLAMLCCLVLATAVTRFWKISLHAAIAAGSVAILAVTYGPWFFLGLGVVAAVCWSRVVTEDHTPAQVLVGSAVGLAIGGELYLLFL